MLAFVSNSKKTVKESWPYLMVQLRFATFAKFKWTYIWKKKKKHYVGLNKAEPKWQLKKEELAP